MTDKNKSLNLLIEKERNEVNEQLLIENKGLKQQISSLLAYISSLESKLNNLYHKEEKEAKNTVKLSSEEYSGCAQMSLEQIKRDELKKIAGENLFSYESIILFPPFNTKPFLEIMKNEGEEK